MAKRMSAIFLYPVPVRIRIFTALKLTTSVGDLVLLESGGTDHLLSEN